LIHQNQINDCDIKRFGWLAAKAKSHEIDGRLLAIIQLSIRKVSIFTVNAAYGPSNKTAFFISLLGIEVIKPNAKFSQKTDVIFVTFFFLFADTLMS